MQVDKYLHEVKRGTRWGQDDDRSEIPTYTSVDVGMYRLLATKRWK